MENLLIAEMVSVATSRLGRDALVVFELMG